MTIHPVRHNTRKLCGGKKKKVAHAERSCKMCFNIFIHISDTPALLGSYFSLRSKKLEGSKGVRMSSPGHETTE